MATPMGILRCLLGWGTPGLCKDSFLDARLLGNKEVGRTPNPFPTPTHTGGVNKYFVVLVAVMDQSSHFFHLSSFRFTFQFNLLTLDTFSGTCFVRKCTLFFICFSLCSWYKLLSGCRSFFFLFLSILFWSGQAPEMSWILFQTQFWYYDP